MTLAIAGARGLAGRRLLAVIPVLWGVTFLTFVVMNLLPGDAAQELLGANATPAQVHQLEIKLHLNQPFWVRYGHWLGGLFHGDLGSSLASGQNVSAVLGQRLPVTAELLLYAFVASILLAVGLAILAARRPNGLADRFSMVVSMTGLSVAPYVLALILVYIFAVRLQLVPGHRLRPADPGPGRQPPVAHAGRRRDRLPAVQRVHPAAAGGHRRAAAARGLHRDRAGQGRRAWRILLRHALPNSLFGLITLVALNLGTLVGAVAIIEPIFSLPGVGAILIQSITNHDVPVVEGIVVVFAVVVVLANLLADVLYAVLDPRIRYERSAS